MAKAFGVPLVAIKRATKLYCERGPRQDSSCLQGVVKAQSSTPKNSSKPALVQGHGLGVVSAQTGGDYG